MELLVNPLHDQVSGISKAMLEVEAIRNQMIGSIMVDTMLLRKEAPCVRYKATLTESTMSTQRPFRASVAARYGLSVTQGVHPGGPGFTREDSGWIRRNGRRMV